MSQTYAISPEAYLGHVGSCLSHAFLAKVAAALLKSPMYFAVHWPGGRAFMAGEKH